VVTVGDSCEADYLVLVICGRCETKRQMHPFRLIAAKKRSRSRRSANRCRASSAKRAAAV
jgi:hypothetical protein